MNVSKLVYTSSATVVVGHQDIIMGDESHPIQKMPLFPKDYAATKAQAEHSVTEAHGSKLGE